MRARFDCPPVIPGSDQQRVNTIHDALVVRGRAVGIQLGEQSSLQNAVDNFRPARVFLAKGRGGNTAFGPCSSIVG